MTLLLGLVLLSFSITSILLVPFIDLLFYLKNRYLKNRHLKYRLKNYSQQIRKSETPIHDKLMKGDTTTPSGGGILLILILIFLSIALGLFNKSLDKISLKILIITLVSFGLLGLIDDIKLLISKRSGKFLGLGRKRMLFIQILLSLSIAGMLYFVRGINNIYIPTLGNFVIDGWYIPLSAFIIISFANAYNISDGLDGLACGLLLICLFAFLALSSQALNLTLASFIGIWIGILFSFLYFNIWPARIFLGDAGSFAFGATLAVVGLLTGKILALGIIGGMFVIIIFSSLIQIISKKFFGKKILPVSPIHMYFKYLGWEEPKIVVRFWLAQGLFAIFGLWIALYSR